MDTLTIAVVFLAGIVVGFAIGGWVCYRIGYSAGAADCLAAHYGLARRR